VICWLCLARASSCPFEQGAISCAKRRIKEVGSSIKCSNWLAKLTWEESCLQASLSKRLRFFELSPYTQAAGLHSEMANATNVLSQGIEITGSIKFSNDMIIDGKINGEIQSDKGKVTIGENANIKGDVKAGEVKLYGRVEGTITSDRCELKGKSILNGDIKTKMLSMEEGASLTGRTQIGG
jgi:cytoskeletal protein CcmA (bactofilin family)